MSAKRSHMERLQVWREDYFASRPPVTCQGCDTYYPTDKDPALMIFSGLTLVECSNCKKPKEPREIDLTEPMPCIVSVKVTDEMIEDGNIPF